MDISFFSWLLLFSILIITLIKFLLIAIRDVLYSEEEMGWFEKIYDRFAIAVCIFILIVLIANLVEKINPELVNWQDLVKWI